MKTTFHKLFRRISLSVALAGGFLAIQDADAQVTKVRKPLERQNLITRGAQIDLTQKHYSPTVLPWDDEDVTTHHVQGEAGKASGGVQVKALEVRAGTYLNNDLKEDLNGVGVGAAGQAHLVRITAGGKAETGTIRRQGRDILGNMAKGDTEAYLGARGLAEARADFGADPRLKAMVGGFAGQNLSASGDVRTKVLGGGLGVNGSTSVGVGVEGSAGVSVDKEGAKIGLGGFAGDKATVSGGFDVLGVGGGVTADGFAGVGAEISSQSEIKGGKLKLKGTLGAALGIGGRVGVDVTVDLNTVREEGQALVDNVEHFGKQAVEQVDREVKQAAVVIERDVTQAANVVAQETTQAANVVAQETTQAANVVAQETTKAANVVAHETSQAANEVKNTFEQTIPNAFNQLGQQVDRDVNQAANVVAQETTKAANVVAQETTKAANDVGNAFKSVGSTIGGWFGR